MINARSISILGFLLTPMNIYKLCSITQSHGSSSIIIDRHFNALASELMPFQKASGLLPFCPAAERASA